MNLSPATIECLGDDEYCPSRVWLFVSSAWVEPRPSSERSNFVDPLTVIAIHEN